MKLYRTAHGTLLETEAGFHPVPERNWDALLNRYDLPDYLYSVTQSVASVAAPAPADLLAPIGAQEVWAAGVTYFRSRAARMEESMEAGGGGFYDRVYSAERPELFFKAAAFRVVGPGAEVRIRHDAKWSVPEPELTLVVNARGHIVGYTAGNDMSSRDIEGENPLYLPQAKVYDGSCALGPCVLVSPDPLPAETAIGVEIARGGQTAFSGSTTLAAMKRAPAELVSWLYRETSFPSGAYLMTGTGVVPPDGFTLAPGDEIRIAIECVGTLANTVAG